MRGNSRRLDVCLGDFAVSIQGFDDPVAVLKDVLHVAQGIAAETPSLLNSEAVFDEDMIGEVIDRVAARAGIDADTLGAVPGLVLVHRGEETDGGLAALRRGARPAVFADDREDASAAPDETAESDETEDGEAPGAPGAPGATAAKPTEDRFEALRRRFEEHGSGHRATAATEARPDASTASEPDDDAGGEDDGARVVNIFGAPSGADAAEATPGAGPRPGEGDGPAAPAGGRRPLFARTAAPGGEDGKPDAKPGLNPVPRPTPVGEAGGLGDRFESLLARVHGKNAEGDAVDRAAARAPVIVASMTPADVATAAGAEDAIDALLSAAAYLTIVRRQPRFTRRELMAVFEEIPGEFPRTLEVQVKGIGKLTRNGSLRRVDDDHFGLSRDMTEKFDPLLRR